MKLSVQLLPPVMRGKLTVALLKVLTLPLRYVYDQLTEHRKNAARRLLTTANVWSMEKALNDAFFLTDNQIKIESSEAKDTVYLIYGIEPWQRPDLSYLYRTGGEALTLKRKGEGSYVDSLLVWVPTFLCTSEDAKEDKYGGKYLREIKILMNYYKPAGRTYRIKLYDYE